MRIILFFISIFSFSLTADTLGETKHPFTPPSEYPKTSGAAAQKAPKRVQKPLPNPKKVNEALIAEILGDNALAKKKLKKPS